VTENPRVVVTAGTFDLLHVGHLALLRECRKIAGSYGRVVVAVNTDQFVTQFKHLPVVPYAQRAELVRSVRYVDDVVPNDGLDQSSLIESLRPDVLAVGVDWATRDYYAQIGVTPQWLHERGISLVYVAHEHSTDVSSTMLRSRIAYA
jgi:glycerol-3-phosphate cytidylyltransferase